MKILSRKKSGDLSESLVFAQLVKLQHIVRFASVNQSAYDLILLNPYQKIEVKHIQRVGQSNRDSFVLKKSQAVPNAFDYLVLLVSDCTSEKGITNFDYYIFSNEDIQKILKEKSSKTGNYTFNLSNDGLSIASTQLSVFKERWNIIPSTSSYQVTHTTPTLF